MNGHPEMQEVDPFGVGVSFAEAFYDVLHQEPESICRFFASHSSFTFAEGDEVSDVQTGPAEIKTRISSLGLTDVKTDVKSIDCQSSWKGSVLVIVHGILYSGHQVPKQFSQTFVLAKAKPTSKNFYVANCSFRFISDYYEETEEETHEVNAEPAAQEWQHGGYEEEPAAEEEAVQGETWPATDAVEESGGWAEPSGEDAAEEADAAEEMKEQVNSLVNEDEEEEEETQPPAPEPEVEATVEEPEAEAEPEPEDEPENEPEPEPEPEAAPEPPKPPRQPTPEPVRKAPTNFLEAVSFGAKPKGAAQQVKGPMLVVGGEVAKTTPVSAPASPPPRPAAPWQQREARSDWAGKGKGQGPPTENRPSVYVAKLPTDVEDDELLKVFSQFGKVMQVRNRAGLKRIAFIDFGTVEAQAKAIAAGERGEVELRGQVLVVQARDPQQGAPTQDSKGKGKGKGKGAGQEGGYNFTTAEGEEAAGAKADGGRGRGGAGGGKGGKGGKGGNRGGGGGEWIGVKSFHRASE